MIKIIKQTEQRSHRGDIGTSLPTSLLEIVADQHTLSFTDDNHLFLNGKKIASGESIVPLAKKLIEAITRETL